MMHQNTQGSSSTFRSSNFLVFSLSFLARRGVSKRAELPEGNLVEPVESYRHDVGKEEFMKAATQKTQAKLPVFCTAPSASRARIALLCSRDFKHIPRRWGWRTLCRQILQSS